MKEQLIISLKPFCVTVTGELHLWDGGLINYIMKMDLISIF